MKQIKYVSLSNDLMAKYILGSQEMLKYTTNLIVSILNTNSEEFREAKILNSVKLDKERIFHKGFESDIIIETKEGTIYNLEIQNVDSTNSRVKNSMYVMRLFGSKLRKGVENYDKSKPVYQIILMNDKRYKNRNKKLVEELIVCSRNEENKYIDDYFKIFIVDINCEIDYTKFSKKIIGWIILFRARSFKEAEEAVKYNKTLKGVIEDMKEYANEEYVQDFFVRDRLHKSEVDSAKEEGIIKGKELGKKEGVKLGKKEGVKLGRLEGIDYANLKIAQKLKDRNMSPSEIKEITGLPLNKIISL